MLKKAERCLYCGAEIIAQPDAAYVRCDACGGRMEVAGFTRDDRTLQAAIEEARAAMSGQVEELSRRQAESEARRLQALFSRAEACQQSGKFEEAARLYGDIVSSGRQEAELHWRLLLCRYGVEYVPDSRTGEYIPTLSRLCTDSVQDDPDYRAAMFYAKNSEMLGFYRAQAQKISDTLQKYMQLLESEKEYDVFISVRQEDDQRRPTRDSQLAQDLYYELTNKYGLRVFNSRIIMPQHAGEEYEPYIMAALMSAKVMVVIGTSPENISSTWVHNEWRRYRWLMSEGDRPRKLIAFLSGMSPKDLPSELGALQAIDGSDLSAAKDLMESICAQFPELSEKKTAQAAAAGSAAPAAPTVNTLLERASILLMDGNFDEASECCDRVLDADPQNARAYMGKVCAAFGIRSERELESGKYPLALPDEKGPTTCPTCKASIQGKKKCPTCGHETVPENDNFARALRYADEKYKAVLMGYAKASYFRRRCASSVDRLGRYQEKFDGVKGLPADVLTREHGYTPESFDTFAVNVRNVLAEIEPARGYQRANVLILSAEKTIEEMKDGAARLREWRSSPEGMEWLRAKQEQDAKKRKEQQKLEEERRKQDAENRVVEEQMHKKKKRFNTVLILGAIAVLALLIYLIIQWLDVSLGVALCITGGIVYLIFMALNQFS